MRSRFVLACVAGSILLGAGSAVAMQCVPYARNASGISLRGDAWTWWSEAAGQYERGQAPVPGAVVVFKKHGAMRHGHVAVVKKVIGPREVLVDHANWGSRHSWGRGRIATNMAVIDVSAHNNWTEVRVWNRASEDYGSRVYPTYGFIYPEGPRGGQTQMASAMESSAVTSAPFTRMGDGTTAVSFARDFALPLLADSDGPAAVPAPVKTALTGGESQPQPQPQHVKARNDAPSQDGKVAVVVVATPAPAPAPVSAKPAPAPAAQAAPAATDGSWDDDAAIALRFGAGRYGTRQ